MTSTFLRSDTILRRQGRTARARRIANLSPTSFINQESPLNIIVEEDENRLSSRSPSPSSSYSGTSASSLALKARRRHATVSDIKIARSPAAQDSNESLKYESPRAAPVPPSPKPSLDSFRLAFETVAPQFPSPPSPYGFDGPDSPTSSSSSSPHSRTDELLLTPTSSDEEGSYVNPYHVAIQPLVITKHSQRNVSPFDNMISVEPTKNEEQILEECPAEVDSDFEWYTRELSNLITVRSPTASSFVSHQITRPDSLISIPAAACPPSRKNSIASTPPTPPPKSDIPASLRRRSARRSFIPNYPPPPPPAEMRSPSISSNASLVDFPMFSASTPLPTSLRPLPRSSIPADCGFDDSTSAFSFSIYEVDLGDERSASSASAYSQPSFDPFAAHDVTFDMEGGMMLPASLPATPNDVDAHSEFSDWDHGVEFVFDDEEVQPSPAYASSAGYSPSFPPSPSLSYYHSSASGSPSPSPPAAQTQVQHSVYKEEHHLKSKWSTSTLASVHQEHARRGASARLRLYFGGGVLSASSKRSSAQSNKKASIPPTPTSPFSGFMSPRKAARGSHVRGNSDLVPMPYGGTVGVRRRGSVATISDAGSEDSSSSTSSTGRRRKPIPIEMFLRSS